MKKGAKRRSKMAKMTRPGRGILAFILISMLLLLLFSATAPVADAGSGWWDANWTKRRAITITGSHPENCQLRVVLPFFDNSIRFLENATAGELSYWVENSTATSMTVWVRRLAASGADSTIYVYYGNPAAASASSGGATFVFFDDFNSDTGGWTNTGAGTWSIENGTQKLVQPTWDTSTRYTLTGALGDNFVLTTRMKANPLSAWMGVVFRFGSTSNLFLLQREVVSPTYYLKFQKAVGGSWTLLRSATIPWTADTWENLEARVFNDNFTVFLNGIELYSAVDSSLKTMTGIGMKGGTSVAAQTIWWDYLRVRRYVSPEPTTSVGGEVELGGVIVSNITCDNLVIDRDADWAAGVVTGTRLQADVEFQFPGMFFVFKENVRFVIYDKNGAIIDNRQATENLRLADNRQRFFVIYRAADNTISDPQLGNWKVVVTARDNSGNVGTGDHASVFCVDDLTSTQNVENLPRHRIRTYGTASRISGISLTALENVWIIDNSMGALTASRSGNNWENIRAPPSAGHFHLRLKAGVLDGTTDNLAYAFPNLAPTIVSVSSSNPLVDRKQDYAGSGAVLTTVVTVRIRDPDNRDDLSAARIGVRDALDILQENIDVWASRAVVDENTLDVSVTVNPPDNLFDNRLGSWDVWGFATDKYGGSAEGWEPDKFAVSDRTSSIGFSPASPFLGWPLTVSGTHSCVWGARALTGAWLEDSRHGTFSLGTGNAYSKTYTVSNASFLENISVTVRTFDGVLDGAAASSYRVNENTKYEVRVRLEENYALAAWVPNENRKLKVTFQWEGGTYTRTLAQNPENIVVPTAGSAVKIVKITDNDAYWRYVIPESAGGALTLVIVGSYHDKIDQYRFYLQDYTGSYIPPDGQMVVKLWIGTALAEINSDYWNADWRMTAWLVNGTQYDVWVRGKNAPLRLVGPIDAVVPAEEKTIVVNVVLENLRRIHDHIAWKAWRESDSIIRVEYRDNLSGTSEASVRIYDMRSKLVEMFQPDNEWFIITWLAAESGESYFVRLSVRHGTYGAFTLGTPVGRAKRPPGTEGGGVSETFGMPIPFAAVASVVLIMCIGMLFDSPRAHLAVIAMALASAFLWYMGWLPLPGGWYTAVLLIFLAVVFALVRRRIG